MHDQCWSILPAFSSRRVKNFHPCRGRRRKTGFKANDLTGGKLLVIDQARHKIER
ncbi:hypothetical protein FLM9_1510 [Candidatus Synechococcus spongiarum]|uniref:Uncharacterized protein n=1 Tax=Candidatus Synechococcus spongiarum TaxID=431041 RepID=A0A170TFI3_9SYNE|nr:hypothetical protein FLM9_1510 [Candidatus Synechococcus spongiarum]